MPRGCFQVAMAPEQQDIRAGVATAVARRRGRINYALSDPCCRSFGDLLDETITESGARFICDLGGGANPALDLEYLSRQRAHCALLDISKSELDKAPNGYERIVADIAARDFRWKGAPFDLVFSRMLAEHVRSGEQFHRNVRALLRPGGYAVHCFPTLYALPFVVNRLVPEHLADRALGWIQPRDRFQHAKFKAYYSWCRGPMRRQMARFEKVGFEVAEYRGLFGHPYFEHFAPLARWTRRRAERDLHRPRPRRTSYAFVVLRAA